MHGPDGMRRPLLASAGLLLMATFGLSLPMFDMQFLTEVFFHLQDYPVLLMFAVFWLLLALWPRLAALPQPRGIGAGRVAVLLALAAGIIALLGRQIVFGGFPLSRDEDMALFDATILRDGQLLAMVPDAWREMVPALLPSFRYPVAGGAAWVSAYLPGNAVLQALFGPLAAPLLASASVLLAFLVGRRLWPQRPDVALVAALVIALSPEVLLTSMTAYAANAHLALNLLWLWLFLRGTRAGHAGAIATGFVATGLHQIAFHPLFVAPFIASLWWHRRFALAGVYTLAYAVIGLFWMQWFRILLSAHGLAAEPNELGVVSTILQLWLDFSCDGLAFMGKNVLRFVGWGFPLLLPLLVAALLRWRRLDATLLALAGGIVLTTVVVFVLQPYQGHGWGYRYWHGCYGGFALLAAAGYGAITDVPQHQRRLRGQVWAAALVAVLFLLPLRALQAHLFAQPYATASRALAALDADVVIVDPAAGAFTRDLVRNDPFLRNRPLMFDLLKLPDAALQRLCAAGPVTLFDAQAAAHFGIAAMALRPDEEAPLAQKRAVMAAAGCVRQLPQR